MRLQCLRCPDAKEDALRNLLSVLVLTTLIACGSGNGPAGGGTAAEYPGPWSSPTPEVMRTLAQNGVQGCGEFYQKRHASSSGEYLVACNEQGIAWTGYLVWTGSGEVMGPDRTIIYSAGPLPNEN